MASNALSDYPEEVLHWMKSKEEKLPFYKGSSPQIEVRDHLVDFIRHVCECLKLSVLTTHLSVQLLDRFMDGHNINRKQLKLTALVVIFLAAKFEERDNNIPRISELNTHSNMEYSIHLFNIMEAFMLKFFDWNVGSITVAHFVELFLMYSITPEEAVELNQNCSPIAYKQLWNATQHFLDITLRDIRFLNLRCSQVAASCLACGRINTCLSPPWPTSLEIATGYSISALADTMELLLNFNKDEEMEVCGTPDSGYLSSSGTPSSPSSESSSEKSFV